MSTLTFSAAALAVTKVVRITKPSGSTIQSTDIVKIGLGSRLVSMIGWSPDDFAATWASYSTQEPFSDVTVVAAADDSYLEFTARQAGTDFELTILVNDAPLSVANEVQKITLGNATGGTFTLTFDGQTTSSIAYNASTSTVTSALEALSNIQSGDVTVTSPSSGIYNVTFQGVYLGTNVPQMTITSSLTGNSSTPTVTTVQNYSTGTSYEFELEFTITTTVAPLNEKQTFKINGNPISGTFTLTYDGQTTSTIAYNASNATIISALEALSNIGVGDVDVTGAALPAGTKTVEFKGALAATNVPQMTSDASSLGGTSSNLTIVTTSSGQTLTTKPKWVIDTSAVTSGSNWYIQLFRDNAIGDQFERRLQTGTFAYNANNTTVKGVIAGQLNSLITDTLTSNSLSIGGKLFHADEITLTNSIGNAAFTIELSESAWQRLQDQVFYPRGSNDVPVITITNGTNSYTGTYTAPTGTYRTERQQLYPLGTIPTTGNFNLDYDGTNTSTRNLNAGAIAPTEIRDLLNNAITPASEVTSTEWWWQAYGTFGYEGPFKVTTPFESADFPSWYPFNTIIELLRPFANDKSNTLSSYVVPLSGSWGSAAATAFNDAIDDYETSQNRIFNCGGTLITPGQSTGAIDIIWNTTAVNNYGDKVLTTVESSSITPSITHATIIQGGTTTISSIEGGFFALVLSSSSASYTIPNIPFNATADEIEDLVNDFFGSTVCSITGGPLPDSSITVTLSGALANIDFTASVIPSFYGDFEGSITPTILRAFNSPQRTDNTYLLEIAPGNNSLAGPQGRIVIEFSVSESADEPLYARSEVSLQLQGLNAPTIEEAINELFGERVVHVTQVRHSLEHAIVKVNPYGSSAIEHRWWYYHDAYKITFINQFADPLTIQSVTLKQVPTVAVMVPLQDTANNTNTNDLIQESYRVSYGFNEAQAQGTPKHVIRLTYLGTSVLNRCVYEYMIEPQYALTQTASRRGIANQLIGRRVQFIWSKVTESVGSAPGGADQTTMTYTPLLYSDSFEWDSGPEQIKYVLERMMLVLNQNPPTSFGSLEDTDDDGISYTPVFFGVNNVQITGSLNDSWKGYNEVGFQTLKVALVNKLDRAPFNLFGYTLQLVFASNYNGENTSNPAQPEPRIYLMESSKSFADNANFIAQYTIPSDVSSILVGFNGQTTTLTTAMSRRQIQHAINSLSTLGRLVPKISNTGDATTLAGNYNPDADIPPSTSNRFYTTSFGIAKPLVRPSFPENIPVIPYELTRSVTVSGSVAARSLTIEMSGNGFQSSPTMLGVGGSIINTLYTITEVTGGSAIGQEIQTIQFPTATSSAPHPTSGTFKLNNGVGDTTALDFDATASEVAAAVSALGANWTCTGSGGPLPGTPITLTFSSNTNISQLTITNSTLNNTTATVTTTTSGGYQGVLLYTEITPGYGPAFFSAPDNWTPKQAPSSQDTLVFDTIGSEVLYGLRQSYSFTYVGANKFLLNPRKVAFYEGQKVYVSTTGTLPSGLTTGYYYIRNPSSDCTFELSSTSNGSIISISSVGAGTHTVKLNAIVIETTARSPLSQLGLEFQRSDDLEEHLCPYLTAGFTRIELGIGSGGDGVNLAKFNTLSGATSIIIHTTSASREANYPAVCLLTNNAATTIVAEDCEVGLALQTGETSLCASISIDNGTLVLRNSSVDGSLTASSSEVSLFNTSLGSYSTL